MAMAREIYENGDQMTGDSVCSTLSDSSLLKCNHFYEQIEERRQQSNEHAGSFIAEDASNVGGVDLDNAIFAESDYSDVNFGDEKKEEDTATFRSVVMRQFKDDIDRLLSTVAQKVENSRSTAGASDSSGGGTFLSSQPNVYSVVKSGCLSLLLSRVLPPLQEQFEQRLIDRLQTAGLLPLSSGTSHPQQQSTTSEVSGALYSQNSGLAPLQPQPQQCLRSNACSNACNASRPPPTPAPRLRTNAQSGLVPPLWLRQPDHRTLDSSYSRSAPHQPQQHYPHPQPKPAPRLLSSAESATTYRPQQHSPPTPLRLAPPAPLPPPPPSAVRQFCQRQEQNRTISPYFVPQKMLTSTTVQVTSSAVRNNSSLKPPSTSVPPKALPMHRQRQMQPPQPPALSCSDLVRTFLIRDSPALRTILFDPDDRKIKSFSQRYGCYISLYEMNKRAGHLLHKVVVRAPSEKALRMCIGALDSGLKWDLASQLNRTNKKLACTQSK